jgi:probable rRNA maturation factor
VTVPAPAARLARVAVAALAAGRAPQPASLGLVLSHDRELAELNAEHMGEQGPTDVLSFPMSEAMPASDAPGFALPPGRRPHLGDIILSVERAAEQAREGRGGQTGDVRWSVADELALLVAHGTLHILGWDHAGPDEEAAMRALESTILELARAGRGGSPAGSAP